MRKPRTIAAAFATALFAVSCGGGGGGSTPTGPSTPPGGGGGGGGTSTVTIAITGQGGVLAFNPNPATVSAGQVVVFKNNDTVAHHVMLDDGTQTPDIPPGATSAAVAIGNSKGYHCTIHPGMVGGFNGTMVEPPPNCNQAYCFGGG